MGTPHLHLQVGQREEIIIISHVKGCTAMDAMPGNPQRRSRLPGPGATAIPAAAQPDGPAATKRISFSERWALAQQPHRLPPTQTVQLPPSGLVLRPACIFTIVAGAAENLLGNRFSPILRGGFCTHWASSSFSASTKAVSAAPAETAYKDQPRPLFSRGQCWGGGVALWRLPG
jgi:hypothetical protein